MGKVLVPIDGSQFTERVISEACELAVNYGLDLVLLNVQTLNAYSSLYESESLEDAEEMRHQMLSDKILNKAVEAAKTYAPDQKIDTVTAFGNPADEIIEYADKNQVDLIVIGSRGMSDIKRFLLGSISNKVVAHAKQSVLVVK